MSVKVVPFESVCEELEDLAMEGNLSRVRLTLNIYKKIWSNPTQLVANLCLRKAAYTGKSRT
jgi:hypothetical protein